MAQVLSPSLVVILADLRPHAGLLEGSTPSSDHLGEGGGVEPGQLGGGLVPPAAEHPLEAGDALPVIRGWPEEVGLLALALQLTLPRE